MRMIVDGRGSFCPGDNSLQSLARQMDHDVRSPLTTICSYAECLAWIPNLEPAARTMYARQIAVQARRLGRLAANFLVLAAPPLSDDVRTVDLGGTVTEAIRDLDDLITVRELTVDWQEPTGALVCWPREVLRQLLLAAVETCLEALPSGATLTLRVVAHEDDGWRLECGSDAGRPPRAHDSFTWRAVETLAGQRGGAASLQTEPVLQLCVRIPLVGRVRHVVEESLLERSA
jgi:hypothetical protein